MSKKGCNFYESQRGVSAQLIRCKNINNFAEHRNKKILFRILFILFLAAGLAEAAGNPQDNCGCDAKSKQTPNNDSASRKLANFNDIMGRFEEGAETVKVIVNLTEPPERATTDWKSDKSLKVLREKIAKAQETVLISLGKSEFRLRHRMENQTSFSGEVTLQGLKKLQKNPLVVSIEPVYSRQPHLRQGIPLMHADTYRSTYNGQGTAIAICDTGTDYRHPMLGNGGFPNSKVIGGRDLGDNDADPLPHSTQAHGTATAGIAAGNIADTGDYIGGVAPGAKLYALKITSGSSSSTTDDTIIAAWDWCVTHKNDDPANPIVAISTSFGGGRSTSVCDGSEPAYVTAVNNAAAAGITLTVSAGNDGYCDSLAYPACLSGVISVGAVYDAAIGIYEVCISAQSCATKYLDASCDTGYYASDNTAADKVCSYSNTASFLTLLAPATRCYTTDIIGSGGYSSGDYDSSFGGTSAACPYTAGAVACLQSAAKTLTGSFLSPSQVKSYLTSTGDNITDTKVAITKPRVNLAAAIDSVGGPPPPPPPAPSAINYPTSSSTGQYTVSWSSSSGATLYQLERSNNGGGSWTQVYSGSNTSYPENISSGGSYRYRIKASNLGGSSNWTTGTWDCIVSLPPPANVTVEFLAGTAAGWSFYNPIGNINRDVQVDNNDLGIIAQNWLAGICGNANGWCAGADIDESNDVTFVDYALFANDWPQQAAENVLLQTIYGTAQDANGTITANTAKAMTQNKGCAMAFSVSQDTVLDKGTFKVFGSPLRVDENLRIRLFNVTGKNYLLYSGHPTVSKADPGGGGTILFDITATTPNPVLSHSELGDGRTYVDMVINFDQMQVTAGDYFIVFDGVGPSNTWGSMVRGNSATVADTMGKYGDGTPLPKRATVSTIAGTGNTFHYELTNTSDTTYTARSYLLAYQILVKGHFITSQMARF